MTNTKYVSVVAGVATLYLDHDVEILSLGLILRHNPLVPQRLAPHLLLKLALLSQHTETERPKKQKKRAPQKYK